MADISGLGAFGGRPTNSAAESAFGGVDELLAAIDAEVDQANRAAAGAYEFVERMKGVRGEGESKDGSVRIVVDSSGTPIEIKVPEYPELGRAFLEAFQAARHEVGAGIADAAVEAYGESSTEAQVFVQQYGTRKDKTGESGVTQSGLSRLQQLESDALHRGQR